LRIVSTLDICGFGRDTPELETALDNLRRFVSAGGEVVYGTDLGNGGIPPGIHPREVVLLTEAGIRGDACLAALARAPLASGAPADLVVLGGDPFEGIEAFTDVRLVMRAGRIVGPG
jgi:imidazolonepropionase-like amidohydrolase